jgi:XRE family transcriptional regulator, regulator of sulfur utilization
MREPTVAMLGEAIKAVRESRGLSVTELSGRAGVNVAYLEGIEEGRRNPSFKSLVSLASALQIQTSVLVALAEHGPGAQSPA